jgi:Anti-sigma-K factor rskA
MGDDERIAYLAGDVSTPLEQAERAELDQLREVLADPAVWAEPSPDLQERVVEAITHADAAAGQHPMRPSASTRPPSAEEPVTGRRPRKFRSWRVGYAVLGAAAAVVLAAGIVAVTADQGSRSRPVEYAASLSGTELAPGASGQVSLTQTTSGWRIHLHATGLPRLDDGRYYEAWLKNAAGVLVPIGTFNEPADVTLWAGVPPSSYPKLTVTRQQADRGPASSGQGVLVGVTHRIH